jgi:hypothetical protein
MGDTAERVVMTQEQLESKRLLRRFLIGILILFPLVLAAWYALRDWLVWPSIWICDQVLTSWFPHRISSVWQKADKVIVELHLWNRFGGSRYLAFPFDASASGTGVPLFITLTILSARSLGDYLKAFVLGIPLLVFAQAVTLISVILVQPPFIGLLRDSEGAYMLWAIRAADLMGYVGLAVFQTILPLILWMLLYPVFVRRMLPSLSRLRHS